LRECTWPASSLLEGRGGSATGAGRGLESRPAPTHSPPCPRWEGTAASRTPRVLWGGVRNFRDGGCRGRKGGQNGDEDGKAKELGIRFRRQVSSEPDLLDLVEGDQVVGAVIELGRPGAGVGGNVLGLLQSTFTLHPRSEAIPHRSRRLQLPSRPCSNSPDGCGNASNFREHLHA
jgi:hypothetical protein